MNNKDIKKTKPYGFWNWGTGIAIAIIISASLMIFLVYKSMNVHFEMAEQDYYAEELKHEGKMIAAKNAASLSSEISILETEDYLVLQFPRECVENKIEGTLVLYRPSAEKKDILLPFKPDQHGRILVDKSKLIKGMYELKANWEMNRTSYNVEKPFFVEFE